MESARRLRVYDKIIERFGTERVAVTGMPETYRARHVLRVAGFALGLPPHGVGDVEKSFPHIRARDIRAAAHCMRPPRRAWRGTRRPGAGAMNSRCTSAARRRTREVDRAQSTCGRGESGRANPR
ncbi:hypothetical protein ABIE67_009178 [Streptomyces sp. V4I8]